MKYGNYFVKVRVTVFRNFIDSFNKTKFYLNTYKNGKPLNKEFASWIVYEDYQALAVPFLSTHSNTSL